MGLLRVSSEMFDLMLVPAKHTKRRTRFHLLDEKQVET